MLYVRFHDLVWCINCLRIYWYDHVLLLCPQMDDRSPQGHCSALATSLYADTNKLIFL